MTETTARTYHTMESLRQMAQTDLRNVNRKELVDINEVEIRKDLSQRERMVDFISQIQLYLRFSGWAESEVDSSFRQSYFEK